MKLARFTLGGMIVAIMAPALWAQSFPRLVVQGVPNLIIRIMPDKTVPVIIGSNQAPAACNLVVRTPATEDQVIRLDNAFERDWVRYDLALGQLGKLSNAERVARTEQLSRSFYRDFGRTANVMIPPQQRDRYIQLGIPSSGYNVFTDAAVIQGLGLTPPQREQFLRLGDEYNLRMNQLNQGLGTAPWNANQQLDDLRRTMSIQVNAILNGRQREQWRTIHAW